VVGYLGLLPGCLALKAGWLPWFAVCSAGWNCRLAVWACQLAGSLAGIVGRLDGWLGLLAVGLRVHVGWLDMLLAGGLAEFAAWVCCLGLPPLTLGLLPGRLFELAGRLGLLVG
jgi:hypothetical protein